MTFKGLILKNLLDLGIRQPDRMEPMNDNDKSNNRLIWTLPNDGMLVFDVLDDKVNYLYDVPTEPIQIYTLHTMDDIIVIALKYLL